MDPAGLSALLAVLGSAGSSVLLVALVALIIAGAIRKWWVPGWVYDESERRAERATQAAMDAAGTAKEMSNVLTAALMRQPFDEQRPSPEKRRGDSGTAGLYKREAGR